MRIDSEVQFLEWQFGKIVNQMISFAVEQRAAESRISVC